MYINYESEYGRYQISEETGRMFLASKTLVNLFGLDHRSQLAQMDCFLPIPNLDYDHSENFSIGKSTDAPSYQKEYFFNEDYIFALIKKERPDLLSSISLYGLRVFLSKSLGYSSVKTTSKIEDDLAAALCEVERLKKSVHGLKCAIRLMSIIRP